MTTAAPSTTYDKVIPIGQIIDRMLELRDRRTSIEKESKKLKEEFDDLEQRLLQRLDTEETNQGRSKFASATVNELTVPTIENWGEFEKYILENNALYMLEKRASGAIYRELISQGSEVPGLKPFVKRSISLRRL